MTILVCGVSSEPPTSFLIDALNRQGRDFLILDQQTLADSVRCRWRLGSKGLEGEIGVDGRVIDIHDITGVYVRFMAIEDMPGIKQHPYRAGVTRSVIHALVDLFEVLPARIVNRRRPMMSNNSKPYQAMLIRQAGFEIPQTLLTNIPERVLEFRALHGQLIYKSASSVRSIVKCLEVEDEFKLSSLSCLATQFQKKIEGFNVRVHVVGDRVFATKIVSSAADYRYASLDGKVAEFFDYELTENLHLRCISLARICKMAFVGIDLIISEDGVYCLEVNPCPAYNFYQRATGVPIADALAEYLSQGCSDLLS